MTEKRTPGTELQEGIELTEADLDRIADLGDGSDLERVEDFASRAIGDIEFTVNIPEASADENATLSTVNKGVRTGLANVAEDFVKQVNEVTAALEPKLEGPAQAHELPKTTSTEDLAGEIVAASPESVISPEPAVQEASEIVVQPTEVVETNVDAPAKSLKRRSGGASAPAKRKASKKALNTADPEEVVSSREPKVTRRQRSKQPHSEAEPSVPDMPEIVVQPTEAAETNLDVSADIVQKPGEIYPDTNEVEVEEKYGNAVEPGYERLREVTPPVFHHLIDKAEVWSASKKADNLSISLAAAKAAVELNETELKALTNQIKEADLKIADAEKDGSLSPQRKGSIISKFETQKGSAQLKLEAVEQKAGQQKRRYNTIQAEAAKYEARRNEIVDRVKAKFEQKAAPHRAKVEVLKDQESDLTAEISHYNKVVEDYESQLAGLSGSKLERRTKRALEKEIKKSQKLRDKRKNELDKIRNKLIPITGTVSRLDIKQDTYAALRRNRTGPVEKPIPEASQKAESSANYEAFIARELDLMDQSTDLDAKKIEVKANKKKGPGFFSRILASLLMVFPLSPLALSSSPAPKPAPKGPSARHVVAHADRSHRQENPLS
jgi:hypothetical protein